MHPFNKSIGHIPVLISDFRKIFPKISGIWVDGTFGFGSYSKYLLEAGVEKLIVIDIGYSSSSVGSFIISNISNKLDIKIQTELFCLLDTPAPTSSYLENFFYHSVKDISKKILNNFFKK